MLHFVTLKSYWHNYAANERNFESPVKIYQ